MNPQDTNQGTPQQQVIERLKSAVNVLVTVSNNPTVDQLATAIGFTLVLNKLGKHATAVFSGDIPSTIEFLQPDSTIEKNTDGLRDFIISLDKSKADKLRYKVEENVVKIFITPYRTTLSDKDLVFSQGDFNVDAVVALGVAEREQLDQAIIAHGRILHDATVITVSAGQQGSSLGAINWQDASASSLGEMLLTIGDALQPGLLDGQIATAYLTGIVAQTERFRNEKTTPKLMGIAAQLMAAGANQQLIASSLEVVAPIAPVANPVMPDVAPVDSAVLPVEVAPKADGSLTIQHTESAHKDQPPEEEKHDDGQIAIDEQGNLSKSADVEAEKKKRLVIEPLPPSSENEVQTDSDRFAGGPHPFTANMSADGEDEPSTDPLTVNDSPTGQLLDHEKTIDQPVTLNASPVAMADTVAPVEPNTEQVLPPPVSAEAPLTLPPALDNDTLHNIEMTFDSQHITQDPTSTLNEIEEVVGSPHLSESSQLDDARNAVTGAIQATPYDPNRPEPRQALNANPFSVPGSTPPTPSSDPVLAGLGLTDAVSPDLQPQSVLPEQGQQESQDPSGQAPPPVPPPMMPL